MSMQCPEHDPQGGRALVPCKCSKQLVADRARTLHVRGIGAPIVTLGAAALLLTATAVHAVDVMSDRVVVIESDARSHTVQHTLMSEGSLVTLELPGSVIPQRVAFGGPERLIFSEANRGRPGRIAIRSGSAFARYRHQYGDAVQPLADGHWRLIAPSLSERLSIDAGDADGPAPDIDAATSWVFPADAQVLLYTSSDPDAGSFSLEANTLAWTQRSATPVTLTIEYRLPEAATADVPEQRSTADAASRDSASAAAELDPVPATPARDSDADGVPDDIDICIGEPLEVATADAPPELVGRPLIDYALSGCGQSVAIILDGVGFPSGQSWLDLPARRALDRVAAALGANPAGLREIAAFTDGNGSRADNLALSARRARAVRQYLLLRGVAPGHLNAGGYGEADPIADNTTSEGRASNRRVVLRPFSAPDGPASVLSR